MLTASCNSVIEVESVEQDKPEEMVQSTAETKNIPVAAINLDPTELELEEGDTAELTATVEPADATDKSVTWESSQPEVATVDASGVVTAISEGTCTITAQSGDKMASCTVIVSKKIVPVESIELNQSNLNMEVGESGFLTAMVLPDDATDKTFVWASTNPEIADLDQDGSIMAKAVGTTTITATTNDGGKTATCSVTVLAPLLTIDGDFSDWTTLEEGTFSEAYGCDYANWPALTRCKVYANAVKIYVYTEWDTDMITYQADEEHVPFWCFINTDVNVSTSGFTDWFTDACFDVMLQGLLYDSNGMTSYDPGCNRWVGGWTGDTIYGGFWNWEDLGAKGFCEGAGIDGKYELSIDRAALKDLGFPVAEVFSMGFAIAQCWEPVGILPNTMPSVDNYLGIASPLKIVTHHR